MIVVDNVAAVREHIRPARAARDTIGCVPTMGALHAGHKSLIDSARRECRFVAVTIFVNPTQFGPHEDFNRYPRPLEDDLQVCREAGAHLVFVPPVETIYPDSFGTFVGVEPLDRVLEGACRPGHFRGVATVVLKLLNIVQPDVAYFGRKDYQQQLIVRKMCRELDLPVEIRTCPTIREPDGLALSSRNRYLNPSDRMKARALWGSLQLAERRLGSGATDVSAVSAAMAQHLADSGAAVDYALVTDPETLEPLFAPQQQMVALVAARLGTTRLIDNHPIVLDAAR